MGLVGHVSPSDGLLLLLVANTALSVSLLKDLLTSLLSLFFLLPSQPNTIITIPTTLTLTLKDRFFTRFKPAKFDSAELRSPTECCVCLSRFEQDSTVSLLSCGHLLHKCCVETWMEYQHATCPMCRAHLLPGYEN